jgi:hypothetical protein
MKGILFPIQIPLLFMKIDKYQSDLFFANVQSFWTKRLPFLSTVKELDQFEFNLAFFEGDKVKKYPLKVLNQDYFKIIVSDRPHFKTEENKLMQILKMLLGIGEFAQAKHALEYDTQFVNDMEAYREFRVEVNGRKLDFYVKNLEIYLANLTEHYVLVYSNTAKTIFGNTPEAFFSRGGE